MEFLQIHDPRKPGDYLVLARRDFDPAVHVPFTEASTEEAQAAADGPAVDDTPKKSRPKAAKE